MASAIPTLLASRCEAFHLRSLQHSLGTRIYGWSRSTMDISHRIMWQIRCGLLSVLWDWSRPIMLFHWLGDAATSNLQPDRYERTCSAVSAASHIGPDHPRAKSQKSNVFFKWISFLTVVAEDRLRSAISNSAGHEMFRLNVD
jgi:hypothetical protein